MRPFPANNNDGQEIVKNTKSDKDFFISNLYTNR